MVDAAAFSCLAPDDFAAALFTAAVVAEVVSSGKSVRLALGFGGRSLDRSTGAPPCAPPPLCSQEPAPDAEEEEDDECWSCRRRCEGVEELPSAAFVMASCWRRSCSESLARSGFTMRASTSATLSEGRIDTVEDNGEANAPNNGLPTEPTVGPWSNKDDDDEAVAEAEVEAAESLAPLPVLLLLVPPTCAACCCCCTSCTLR